MCSRTGVYFVASLLLVFSSQLAGAAELEEIIVTTRKITEDVQRVPESVTVYSGTELLRAGIGSFDKLADYTPSLYYTADTSTRTAVAIRGIGATTNPAIALGVGVVVDGVYEPGFEVFRTPFVDIDQIEVLRGPQGTLYGKNTLAGAVVITTPRPTEEFSGKLYGVVGNGNTYGTSLVLSGPIVENTLLYRASVSYGNTDGFYSSDLAGISDSSLDGQEALSFRGRLLYTPVDNLEFDIGFKYSNVDESAFGYGFVDSPSDFTPTFSGGPSPYTTDVTAGYVNVTFSADPYSVSSITSYTYSKTQGWTEADLVPARQLELNITDTRKSFTEEIRVTSNAASGPSRWLLAFFYNRETKDRDREAFLFGNGSRALTEDAADTYALYGQYIRDLGEKASLTVGLRYGSEEREQTTSPIINSKPTTPNGRFSETFAGWEPKISLSYDVMDDVMAYGTIAKGTRSGGFNNAGVDPQDQAFDMEEAWTYEIGVKSDLLEHRLRLNGAVFYIDNKDLIGDAAVNGFNISTNIGDGNIKGIEVELLSSLSERLEVTANLTYLDSEITSVAPDARYVNLAVEDRYPLAASSRFVGGVSYAIPVSNGWNVKLRGEVVAVGEYAHDTFGNESEPYEVFNLSASLFGDNKWDITAFVNNVSDEEYFDFYLAKSTVPFWGRPAGLLADPRTYGVRASYSF